MELNYQEFRNELDKKAEGLSRTDMITDSIQGEIIALLSDIEETINQSSISITQYHKILNGLIESRHETGVHEDSPYYYFYKAISNILCNKHTKKQSKKIYNKQNPITMPNTKSLYAQQQVNIPNHNQNKIKNHESIYSMKLDPEDHQLFIQNTTSNNSSSESNMTQRSSQIVDNEILPIPQGLYSLYDQWKTNNEDIFRSYEKSNYSDVFKYVSILHNTYLDCFHPVYQNDIKKLYKAVQQCKDQKPFFIRMYLQNNHLNVFFKLNSLLKTIELH